MARDRGAWGDLISLSWSVPGIIGDGKRLEEVRHKLVEYGLDSVHKMKQVTARSRALIAIGLSQSPEKGTELLDNFRRFNDWGKWECAVAESLSVEGSIGPDIKTSLDKLNELQIPSSSKPAHRLTDKYATGIHKKDVEVPEKEQDFKIRPEYRRSDLLRIQESTQQRSPFVSSRPSPDTTMRRPSLKPLSKLPKLDSLHKKEGLQRMDSVHRKGSFARSNSLKSKLTSASAKRPKMLMEDDNMAMDPDSLGATLIRDAEKKKEKELQAEKRRHEMEERRREREEKKEQEMLKRKSSKHSSKASDSKNDAKEPDGPSKGARTQKVQDAEKDDGDRQLKRKSSGTRPLAGRTRKLQKNDKPAETSNENAIEAKDEKNSDAKEEKTSDAKDEKTHDVEKEAQGEEPSAESAPEIDVDQILGPDQNALSITDRQELEHFLNGSKNIFEDGQNKRDFVIHEAKKQLDGGDPELSHIVETIVFQASRDWQWRKLKRKRTYKRDSADDATKADGD
uniref:Uncharacterized protein n=1 Tax=Rhodosorus marinus TaxID=101924 RepID=A0A7S2ZH74_9RHOD|mmetsp:Transcript_18155/g.72703  ORF Transcript_18155/g.72703 Transcript_18155/m.72703 type:complete len:509 (+) Transcript_18155:445-1971(+)|eukprot:CAMPEP_0113960014 /NCGR_PEP_ID=MMETSP0011_2-20120614/4474_1 /TAXON_ID=101924 /ORGANISM="Rhodosorus marinus" /LENGTH=508 /DNA_ID=CAMNT_0000971409 /DNA_START=316 /DNA_END=1842 /DNA_ORIENTATION=- /assembly_acc=CAM_ASM_000156